MITAQHTTLPCFTTPRLAGLTWTASSVTLVNSFRNWGHTARHGQCQHADRLYHGSHLR